MTPTVVNLLNVGERYLRRAGVLTHRLSSERILEYIMKRDRISLYLDRSLKIASKQRKQYFRFLRKRAKYYPLQYLVGEAHFMDFAFEVSEECLIPRPETELLVEHVLAELKRMIPSGEVRILDIGTGSGNIALSLAKYLPFSEVWGTDVSRSVLELAERNAARLDVLGRARFIESNLFNGVDRGERFECVVSNPPYLSEADLKELEGELLFEPRQALLGGRKGSELMIDLAEQARDHLKPGGLFAVEMGMGQGRKVKSVLKRLGYRDILTLGDYAGIERIAMAHAPVASTRKRKNV